MQYKNMDMAFCKRLKELRSEKELRQADLAKVMNIAYNTISSWERGNSSPSIEQLKMLAQFFEVRTDYLLGIED